jgi:ABC-2 type transport system ATP-binding protein
MGGTSAQIFDAKSTDKAIRTEDLRKTYKTSRGNVDAVLVQPTGGTAWVAGVDVTKDPVTVKRKICVVTQNNTLDMQLTVAENLEFRSRFFGLSAREASRRAAQLIDAFGLGDRRKAMSSDLSGGQARRLLIARALVHRPGVLFLDEPTAGLDPQRFIQFVPTIA